MEQTCPSRGHQFDKDIVPGLQDSCPKCMVDFLTLETGDLESDLKTNAIVSIFNKKCAIF